MIIKKSVMHFIYDKFLLLILISILQFNLKKMSIFNVGNFFFQLIIFIRVI